jgi:hypothetical protein
MVDHATQTNQEFSLCQGSMATETSNTPDFCISPCIAFRCTDWITKKISLQLKKKKYQVQTGTRFQGQNLRP